MVIGQRERATVRGSNFGVRTESHFRTIGGVEYLFTRMTWKDGKTELRASRTHPRKTSAHYFLGFK